MSFKVAIIGSRVWWVSNDVSINIPSDSGGFGVVTGCWIGLGVGVGRTFTSGGLTDARSFGFAAAEGALLTEVGVLFAALLFVAGGFAVATFAFPPAFVPGEAVDVVAD